MCDGLGRNAIDAAAAGPSERERREEALLLGHTERREGGVGVVRGRSEFVSFVKVCPDEEAEVEAEGRRSARSNERPVDGPIS